MDGKQRFIVFVLTFGSYALYHASRKNLSGVKSSVVHDWVSNSTGPPLFNGEAKAQTFLGTLDALFMICYAVALVYWGWLGDRFNPRNVVVLGMFGSACTLMLFGYLPHFLSFYSVPYYLIVYAGFGIFQACGWPNEVTIMANWFDKNNRGLIMGMWAACQPLGNILGSLFVSFILPYGYVNTFLFNSLLIAIGACVLWVFVETKPSGPLGTHMTAAVAMNSTAILNRQDSVESTSSISSTKSDPDLLENQEHSSYHHHHVDKRKITILQALRLPTVIPYCLCNACLKFVNYAFFFWLPFYLTHKYGWNESEANQLSVMYDFGGIFGSVAGGFISDRLGFRSPILMFMLVLSLPLLSTYANLGPNRFFHVLVMTFLGAAISGPYNLIVGTIAVDLGSQKALAGNTDAMSTVTGLIDATGSAGSAIGQLFVPIIQNSAGWKYVFYLFIIMNMLSSLCLLKRFLHDVYALWKAHQLGVDAVEAERTTRNEGHPLLA